jgi:hypothetical protein
MYKLIANPYYIKREQSIDYNVYNNVYNNGLYLKIKERHNEININDLPNIVNLIDEYFKNKLVEEIVEEIINECITDNTNKNETRLIKRVPGL